MYLGIDVGATKTLVAVFNNNGNIVKETKISTNKNYQRFLIDLKAVLSSSEFTHYHIVAACCALPGSIDRENGAGIRFGNLDWQNVPVKKDLEMLLGLSTVYVENDAKLAALFEYRVEVKYKKILYITIGTGIGIAVIDKGQIDLEVEDLGGAIFMLEHEGRTDSWDNISSGRVLAAKYGKKAGEIEDSSIWKDYVVGLSTGLSKLIEKYNPDAIIIGGGVGAHLEKFKNQLKDQLTKFKSRVVTIPPIIQAQRPEDAVIYGCYDFIRQKIDAPV